MGAATPSLDATHCGRAPRAGEALREREAGLTRAITMIMEGASRTEAARAQGMELQLPRGWVSRCNAEGFDGLADRQLGGREDANPLIFHNRTSKGRHYRAPNGGGESRALRRRSAVRAVAAGSCRAGAEGARAPCSAGCGAAGRGAGRRWSADGHPPSGWRRAPR